MRVLFVSKPVMPPWNDGSKNLVRDVASHVRLIEPTIMVAPGAPSLGARVRREPVYGIAGIFAPSNNALVLNRLLFGHPLDAWNFVFAPNLRSSSAARAAMVAQRARGWNGPVVQTVASRPKEFHGSSSLFFGDIVVALSEWTRQRLRDAGVHERRIRLIAPCAEAPRHVTAEEIRAFRDAHELGDGPVVVYPGDLEVSTGARTVAEAAPEMLRRIPGLRIIFACRPKSARAQGLENELRAELGGAMPFVRFLGQVPDMAVLQATADVLVFPVDDLYGKVDLPLVILEALALGTPMVLARGGPLEEIEAARFVAPRAAQALADETCALLEDEPARNALGEQARALHRARFTPEIAGERYDALYAELGAR